MRASVRRSALQTRRGIDGGIHASLSRHRRDHDPRARAVQEPGMGGAVPAARRDHLRSDGRMRQYQRYQQSGQSGVRRGVRERPDHPAEKDRRRRRRADRGPRSGARGEVRAERDVPDHRESVLPRPEQGRLQDRPGEVGYRDPL